MNITVTVFGRPFDLNVDIEERDGKVSHEQLITASRIADFNVETAGINSTKVFMIAKDYITANTKQDVCFQRMSDVLEYIFPRSVFIPYEHGDEYAVFCDFPLNDDNGFVMLFKDGKFIKVCSGLEFDKVRSFLDE